MARTVKDANLGTSEARRRLKIRGKPHWRVLEEGLHIGYRRVRSGAGKWVARCYKGTGKDYHVETFALADDNSGANGVSVLSFSQAQQKARELRDDRDRTGAGKGKYTVGDATRAYIDFVTERRKSGDDIRGRIEAFVIPKLGDIEASKLTTDDIEKWLNWLARQDPRIRTKRGAKQRHRQTDGSPEAQRRRQATANRIWTSLRAALNRAFKAGRIASDGAWRRVEAFRGVDAARTRLLSEAECRRLVNGAASDFRRLVMAGLATGARYGELAALQALDFNGDAVHIRKSKNGRERWIRLNAEGIAVFKSIAAGKPADDLLLTRDDGSPWEKNYQQIPMREACTNGHVSPCSFHALRHAYASLAVMNGCPLVVVAKNLGHANTRMVEKHYGHLAKDYMSDAIARTAPTFGFDTSTKVTAIR